MTVEAGARPLPLLGDVALTAVQRVEHALDAGFAGVPVIGLAGHAQQRTGRPSHRVTIDGVLFGATALDEVATLQGLASDGVETTFAADIVTALDLQQVVIASFAAVESAGVPGRIAYRLEVVESPPLPPPAQLSGFGGLDDFGFGDLGFDTDLLDDLAGLAEDIGGAVDAAMDAVAALEALASLGDLSFGGELAPLEDVSASLSVIGSSFRDAAGALGELFGLVTVLATAASVTLGNLRYDQQVAGVTVELGLLPAVSSAVVRFPVGVEVSATPGDDASVDLDGGEGASTVLTGAVLAVFRGRDVTEVLVGDASVALAAVRPATTIDSTTVADAIRSLASDAGVSTGLLRATMQLATYAAHQQRTAAEHIAHLAHLAGAVAVIDADGTLHVEPWPAGPATTALRYDREFVQYRTRREAAPSPVVLVGGGPAGSAAAPDALAQTVEALTGGAGDPGPDRRWVPQPVLRTPSDVAAATRAEATTAGAGSTGLTGRCWLQPALRPGTVLEVQEVPAGVDAGPWLVTAVTHALAPGGASTDVTGVSAGVGGGDGGLLAAVAGAVGSLL